ncbi:MAG: 2-dehydropantoate 2-reductase [Sulfolobales archaeon]|nr:2-dehydropantoate 2-reductase [Sulfolobales archaeon]MCX8209199.1 2-dehydropantoate 2-reductase [Sulfolobales archaeon]MDW8010184.1 2-dehydropantoate 2-reductase [Sulfolobales archaeon]
MKRIDVSVLVVGFGSIGSLIVYALNRVGIEPAVVSRSTPRGRAIRTPGGSSVELRAEVSTWDSLGDRWDYVFVTTKAYDALDVVRRLRGIDFKLAVFTQNGLKVLEVAEEVLGVDSVAQLVLNHGVFCNEELREFVWVGGTRSYLGMKRRIRSELYELAKYLKVLDVVVVDDIEPYRWLKLAVNASINALTAILGVPNGFLIKSAELVNVVKKVAGEVSEVARGLGVELPSDPVAEVLKVAEKTANNISSMLSDLRRCRKTEVDFINGAVVEFGRSLSIPTPYNELLYSLVKSLELVCRSV